VNCPVVIYFVMIVWTHLLILQQNVQFVEPYSQKNLLQRSTNKLINTLNKKSMMNFSKKKINYKSRLKKKSISLKSNFYMVIIGKKVIVKNSHIYGQCLLKQLEVLEIKIKISLIR